jgi:hypothetical protein
MKPRLIVSFQHYGEPEFQAKVGYIITCLTGNAHYPEPWAPQVSSLAQLNDTLSTYRLNYTDGTVRDTARTRARGVARETLSGMLHQLAPYLEMMAQGDVTILETTGYDLRRGHIRSPARADLLPAPGDFRVTRGRISGTLEVRMARLAGAVSYEVSISQGDGSPTGEWTHAITAASNSRIVLQGLQPGQSFWVRARGIASNGGGLWTEPVKLLVV